jgi:hypothetical protein
MSWLIEDESIDRFVLDDVYISDELQFERDIRLTNEEQSESEVPVDFVSLQHHDAQLLNSSIIMLETDQDSVRSGVTILPSCSSSSLASDQNHQSTSNTNIITDSSHGVLLTNESESALSINPDSIDSSILTEFSNSPLISSVVSEEIVNDTGNRSNLTNCVDFMPLQSKDSMSIKSSCCSDTDGASNIWYSHFESENDWDEFREKTKQLLEAVDCPLEERDELIAQLITMEEKMFWESKMDNKQNETVATQSNVSWLLEIATLSVSVVVAGVMIVRILKGR